MFTSRTTRALAVAGALAVAWPALITPHTPAAVTAVAAQVAGVSPRLELSSDLQVLPAPATSVAPVVVPAPQIPPQPPARTAHDAPALAAHTAAVQAAIAQTATAHTAAAVQLAQARTTVLHAQQQLQAAQQQAVQIGAPVPQAPKPPAVPPVTTPDGQPAPVQASVPAVVATVAAATAPAVAPTVPPADTGDGTVGDVNQQVAAIRQGQSAQKQLASAQATLVQAATAEQVTATQLLTLDGALASSQQALATLPPPDPRWPDGCPTDAPGNTLRNGAATIGIAQLCADSVAAAPTPQAALAIKWALNHLGIPYSQPRRNEDGFADCSSFVSRAYTAAGVPLVQPGVNSPTTETIRTAPWGEHIGYAQAQPGDLVEPEPGHVVMVLADGFIVHTADDGDVSHVRNAYFGSDPYMTIRIDPAHAGS